VADRPYGEFYDFYNISLENFGYRLVYNKCLVVCRLLSRYWYFLASKDGSDLQFWVMEAQV
jgi:hypothetical protein